MRFPAPPIAGTLVRRYKRFFADVEVAGELVTAHCANTGSLLGCCESGSEVWLRDSAAPGRKLRYTWQAIRVGPAWVNVDTSLPNRVVMQALAERRLRPLGGYAHVQREVPYGNGSRIDLLLTGGRAGRDGRDCYVEVKNTTLAEGRAGLFPDAVTARGLKHLRELAEVVRRGHRAVQLFYVSRGDVTTFRPADAIDPKYCEALREAAAAGVEVLAYRARVSPAELDVDRRIPIDLSE